jgi:hypothetical protein
MKNAEYVCAMIYVVLYISNAEFTKEVRENLLFTETLWIRQK